MALTFDAAKAQYQADQIIELSNSDEGRRFLLMRSLSRTEHLKTLAEDCNVTHSRDAPVRGSNTLCKYQPR